MLVALADVVAVGVMAVVGAAGAVLEVLGLWGSCCGGVHCHVDGSCAVVAAVAAVAVALIPMRSVSEGP